MLKQFSYLSICSIVPVVSTRENAWESGLWSKRSATPLCTRSAFPAYTGIRTLAILGRATSWAHPNWSARSKEKREAFCRNYSVVHSKQTHCWGSIRGATNTGSCDTLRCDAVGNRAVYRREGCNYRLFEIFEEHRILENKSDWVNFKVKTHL